MARLITNHDPFHIHKILGLFVLLHYIYRYFILFKNGNAFPQDEDPLLATICVIIHGVLSWSSLLLPLPVKRNFGAPMIWPEFRLHSILFATRHVISTVLTLNDLWPSNLALQSLSKISLVVLTSRLAALITSVHGCNDNRTTNTMPYPTWSNVKQQKYIKYQYARAQFVATNFCMLDDPTRNFTPILAIQIAPLMMTLVRKGKATAFDLHRVYFLSLWISFIGGYVRVVQTKEECGIFFSMATFLLIRGRIAHGFSHSVLWTVHGITMYYLYPLYVKPFLYESGISDYLQYSYVLGVIPFCHFIHELMMDQGRPFLESVKYWPFLNFDEKFYESRFKMVKYHVRNAQKKDAWSQQKKL